MLWVFLEYKNIKVEQTGIFISLSSGIDHPFLVKDDFNFLHRFNNDLESIGYPYSVVSVS